jgi:hypothetical protein
MKIQLEEFWEKIENQKVTGYFHPSNEKIKRSNFFIDENVPGLSSVIDPDKAFIIEGWVLLTANGNEKHSIYIFRENDKYQIKEFNIDSLIKDKDNAFMQEFNFKADDIINKITGIKSIRMKKVYKYANKDNGIYKIKPYCYYFDGFE